MTIDGDGPDPEAVLEPSPPSVGEPHGPMDPVPVEVVAPAPRAGRAGRDLPAAIAIGVGLAAVVVASLYTRREAFVALVVLAMALGTWELAAAFATRGIRLPVPTCLVGTALLPAAAYAGGTDWLVVALALAVLLTLGWRLGSGPDGYLADATAGVFATLYLPFLAAFAVLLVRADDGPQRVTVFVLVTVLSDVGGYAVGVLFGRHPMAPTVSPKKSWEGFAGSLLFCTVGGAAAVVVLLDGAVWQGVLLGLAGVLTSTFGDLAESMIKRDLGIKDMGSLLPGHGGVMDRLDSLLPSAPVSYLLLTVLLPPG